MLDLFARLATTPAHDVDDPAAADGDVDGHEMTEQPTTQSGSREPPGTPHHPVAAAGVVPGDSPAKRPAASSGKPAKLQGVLAEWWDEWNAASDESDSDGSEGEQQPDEPGAGHARSGARDTGAGGAPASALPAVSNSPDEPEVAAATAAASYLSTLHLDAMVEAARIVQHKSVPGTVLVNAVATSVTRRPVWGLAGSSAKPGSSIIDAVRFQPTHTDCLAACVAAVQAASLAAPAQLALHVGSEEL